MPIYGGSWNQADHPQRSALFINFKTLSPDAVQVDALGVAAIVGTSDWGPENTVYQVDSFDAAKLRYHDGQSIQFAIRSALLGEGSESRSGVRSVLAYRMVGSGAVKAFKALSNTTPAVALTLTAKYAGTRGNSLLLTVAANPDTTKHDLLLYEGTTLLEKYTYVKTNLASVATAINATSNYMTAVVNIDGVALATVTSQAMSTGTNGAALTGAEHTAAQAALEARAGEFSVLALDVTPTDMTIRGTWRDWTNRVSAEGGLFHWVVGGAASETVATAILRSFGDGNAMDSEWIVNVTRDLTISGVTYSSSQMAARVAGIIAASGVSRSASFAKIEGATLVNQPTSAETELLVRGRVIPFVYADGVVMLQRGRTTWTSATSEKNEKWTSLLNVRKIAYAVRRFARLQLTITGADGAVNDGGVMRDAILGRLNALCESLVDEKVLLAGTKVELDTTPGLDNENESLHVKLTAKPVAGIEQILATWVIPA